MPTYLMENEVAFDPDCIGFPGLGSCMGIVIHTDTGLFGFHCPPGMEDRVRGFSQFNRAHAHHGNVLGLYSGTRFLKRWEGVGRDREVLWQEELKYMATALGYRGIVWGYDMTNPSTGITEAVEDNAYLEFKLRIGDDVPRISTAVMRDLDVVRESVPAADTTIRAIRPPTKMGYELRAPYSATAGESRITTRITERGGGHKLEANGLTGFYFFHQH